MPLQVKCKSICREGYRERRAYFNPGKSTKQYKNSIFLHLLGKKRQFDSQSLCDKTLKETFPVPFSGTFFQHLFQYCVLSSFSCHFLNTLSALSLIKWWHLIERALYGSSNWSYIKESSNSISFASCLVFPQQIRSTPAQYRALRHIGQGSQELQTVQPSSLNVPSF